MEKQITNIEANVRAFTDNVEETRTVTFIASTSTKDRHGTVLNQKNWNLDNFNRNPIIGYQHNVYGGNMCSEPNPDDQLGTAKAYLEPITRSDGEQDNQLLVDITFEPADINPKAEKIFRKVMHGSLRAVSVGFVPLKNEKGEIGEKRDGAFHFFGQELLEISVVNIPSNPDALKKSFREDTSRALTFLTKALNVRYSEIEEMKVRDILDILDGKKENEEEKEQEVVKKEGKNIEFCKKMLILQHKVK